MYIDSAYTLETVERKGHRNFFETRHSEGFFDHVWGVHPIADAAGAPAGDICVYEFSPRQTVIEGVARRHRWPRVLAPLDLVLSQGKLLRMLAQIIRREQIDLIFATDVVYCGLFGAILKAMTGRPLAIGIYQNLDFGWATGRTLAMPRLVPWRWLQALIVGFTMRRANLVVGGTQNYLDYGNRHGAAKAQQAMIPIARYIEPCHLSDPSGRAPPDALLERLGVPRSGRYMIMVSRLKKLKFADQGVRAMIAVAERDPLAVGIVAGDGPLQPELEALVRERGVSDRIIFVGHLRQEALSCILPLSVAISPLTGMALVEAGLGGSPVVAFDMEWQAEFVIDGMNGFTVPMNDTQAMAERTLQLLNDEALRRRMSQAMRAHALEFADRARIARLERAVFARLLDDHAAVPNHNAA